MAKPAPDIPLATYRLQLSAEFGFNEAAAIVPYLKQLGITHLYASPFLKARAGSTHGYDIVDHNALNPELGGEAAFVHLSDTLKQHGLGLILDFVPNHMGVHYADNAWWLSVLEWGQASPYAAFFDIDWDMLSHRNRPGVLLPILGTSYGQALETGEIELRFDAGEGSFSAWYYEHRLPIAPQRYGEILEVVLGEATAAEQGIAESIKAVVSDYRGLHRPTYREAPDMKAALAAIDGAADLIERCLSVYRAGPDRSRQTLLLHHLLERQHYRLADWRLATSDINYRRFFDVNTLAGLRVEHAATFESIHALVRRLISEGRLQGLRLDHIDGLLDPAQYCRRLQRLVRVARKGQRGSFYTVLEKILGERENLPRMSGIHGTTGYEMLNTISRVLVDDAGLGQLDETWRQVSNTPPDFAPVLMEAKRQVIQTLLSSEFTVLSHLLARIAAGNYATRDFSAESLRQALELYVLCFPVYRTYLTSAGPSSTDRLLIEAAIEEARSRWSGSDSSIFDFLRDALTLDLIGPMRPLHSKPRVRRFATKIQQFTGPAMAKSLEDTAFYRYHRLLALNEVGGDAAASGLDVPSFHHLMSERASAWPHAMTATATHDTKRGEDARARLLALSELPGEWTSAVGRWKTMNADKVVTERGRRIPSIAHEYMLYQALIGAWPLSGLSDDFIERMQAYAIKAAREGKQETSWLNPRESYENRLREFLAAILDPKESSEFLTSFEAFASRTALLGSLNSLAQTTLKVMMPGVPDLYQGTESWDFSLVDPDNRRPVDFAARAAALTADPPDWSTLAASWPDGRLKMLWIRHLLDIRGKLAETFRLGDYVPLDVRGPHRDHVIAFARRLRRHAAIVVVTRQLAAFTDGGRQWPRLADFEAVVDIADFKVSGHAGPELKLGEALSVLPVAVFNASVR